MLPRVFPFQSTSLNGPTPSFDLVHSLVSVSSSSLGGLGGGRSGWRRDEASRQMLGVLPMLAAIFLSGCLLAVQGLTMLERNELSRKFKYYFRSVRPVAQENILRTKNGTFFSLKTAVHIVESRPEPPNSLTYALVLSVSYTDDRLTLREIIDRFEVPLSEFDPWRPRVVFSPPPSAPSDPSLFLSPNTGLVSITYKVKSTIGCTSRSWKHPFDTHLCTVKIDNQGDEYIDIVEHGDLRQEAEVDVVAFQINPHPSPSVVFSFSPSWLPSLVSVYLPSALVFAVVLFAQWKRRKIQVVVTVTALICLMILFSRRDDNRSVNLLDLWLCSTFLHTIFLLVVDLTLPSRRIRYTLMLDVDGSGEYRSVPSREATPSPSAANGHRSKYSPLLGGQRAFLAVQKYAVKRFGAQSVETRMVNETKMPIQRQIQTSSIGYRKRIALAFTLCSYFIFCVMYFFIVATID